MSQGPRYPFSDEDTYPLPFDGETRVWIMLCNDLNQNFLKQRFIDIAATKDSKTHHYVINVDDDITLPALRTLIHHKLRREGQPENVNINSGAYELYDLVGKVKVPRRANEKDFRNTKDDRLVERMVEPEPADPGIDNRIGILGDKINTGLRNKVVVILPSLAHSGSRTSGSSRSVSDLCNHTTRVFCAEQALIFRTSKSSHLLLHPSLKDKLIFTGSKLEKTSSLNSLVQTLTTTKLTPYFTAMQSSTSVSGSLTIEMILEK